MNREATKSVQPESNDDKMSLADEIHVETSVLYFCLDHSGKPFEFVYNDIPLGNQIAVDCPGLPEPLYQSFIFFQKNLQQKFKPLTDGYNELKKTLCFDGKIYTFLFSKFSLPLGDGATAMISIRDVTAINKMEGDNNINEILMGVLIENMTDVFCVFDMNGKLTFVSPSIQKVIGYDASELMRFPITEFVVPESKQALENAFTQLLGLKNKCSVSDEDKEPIVIEAQFVDMSKELRWAEISLAPYSSRDNKIKGIYGIIRDISEYKQEQADMQSSLQYEIERGKVKSKYISSISHEFRTPLSIIYSNLQLLESHQHELDAETIADSYDLSKMAVKSLLLVLDKVTIIDASGKGKLEFKPALLDLPELVQSVVNDLNEMEIVPGRIKFSIDPAIGQVYIDEYLFRHIFSNVLHNALKYSDKKQFVEMDVALSGNEFLTFEVKDEGIGIPKEDMGILFEPFYRASNARYIKGSGLGLSVINECLKLHHGTITLNSEVGRGTTVNLTLPIAYADDLNLEND